MMFRKSLAAISGLLLLLAGGTSCSGELFDDIRVTKLENGLRIVTREVHVAPVVSVNVFYRVGSRNEHTGITGVSHLLEHLMFKGTKSYPTGAFEQMIRERGGVHNAATSTDYTYYWELLQSDYLDLALKLEADRMQGALVRAQDLASEMVVVRSELEGRENSPDSLLWDLVNATAFTAHPYQWPVIGWRADVEGVTRDEIYSYYRRHYSPGNATVVLVGDFDTAAAVATVRKHFGSLKNASSAVQPRTVEPEQRGERRVTLQRAGSAERALLAFGIPGGSHQDIYALDVLEQVLSGGRSGRLYQTMVEKGLATDSFAYSATRVDPSLIYFGATAQQGKTASALEAGLLGQIKLVQEEGVTQQELDRAKRQIEAALVFSNDDVNGQAQMIGRFAVGIGLDKLKQYLPSIRKVTAEDVQRVARKYLAPEKMTVGYFQPVGPPAPEAPASPMGPQSLSRDRWGTTGLPHYRSAGTSRAAASAKSVSRKVATPGSSKPAKLPPAARPKPSQLAEPVRRVLSNGLTLVVLRNPTNPAVSVAGSLQAGSWLEYESNRGAAGFTADLLDRGTSTRSSLGFATAVEEMGASLSFSSSVETVSIDGRCLTRDFEAWMALLADALRHPSFQASEIDKLRQERLSALEQERESPDAVSYRAFMNILYPSAHPYHPGTLEERESAYRSIDRNAIESFYRSAYGPRGMVLAVVGDVQVDECVRLVEKHFADWKPQEAFKPVSIPAVAAGSAGSQFVKLPDKSETSIVYGWPSALSRSSGDYYAAAVANDILGGGVLTSRLGKSIRGKGGLVYDVSSSFQASLGAGPWMASLGTNPDNAAKALQQLRAEIERYYKGGPTDKEVSDSKTFITGILSLRLATNQGIASMLRSAEIYSLGPGYIRDFRSLYGAVTPEAVRSAIRKYFHPEAAYAVVTGPREVGIK